MWVRLALGGCQGARAGHWVGWLIWLTLLALSLPATAAGFEQRLAAVEAAVDAHLSGTTSAPAYPKPYRKILWLRLQGDPLPDALVVLRPGRNECGAAALSARSCLALLLVGQPDGAYRVATEFALLLHPIALRLDGQGQVTDLMYSRDVQANPSYAPYRWVGDGFQRQDGNLDAAQVQRLPTLIADDRNMALLEDQRYAARNFNNTDAWLAPYRLHYDAVAIAERRQLADSALTAKVAQSSVERLLPMVQDMAKAYPWSQTLEVRLWSCVDWMVPRRFWEVEGQRLGRLGTCIEPALIIPLMGGDEAAVLGALRQQLTQQFGMAMLLRTAPLAATQREALRRSGSSVFNAAVAGMWMGHATRTHSIEQAATAIQVLRKVSDRWFEKIEFEENRYVSRTPELRAFDDEIRAVAEANQCLRRVLKQPPSKLLKDDGCSKERFETAQAIVGLVQEVSRQ